MLSLLPCTAAAPLAGHHELLTALPSSYPDPAASCTARAEAHRSTAVCQGWQRSHAQERRVQALSSSWPLCSSGAHHDEDQVGQLAQLGCSPNALTSVVMFFLASGRLMARMAGLRGLARNLNISCGRTSVGRLGRLHSGPAAAHCWCCRQASAAQNTLQWQCWQGCTRQMGASPPSCGLGTPLDGFLVSSLLSAPSAAHPELRCHGAVFTALRPC